MIFQLANPLPAGALGATSVMLTRNIDVSVVFDQVSATAVGVAPKQRLRLATAIAFCAGDWRAGRSFNGPLVVAASWRSSRRSVRWGCIAG